MGLRSCVSTSTLAPPVLALCWMVTGPGCGADDDTMRAGTDERQTPSANLGAPADRGDDATPAFSEGEDVLAGANNPREQGSAPRPSHADTGVDDPDPVLPGTPASAGGYGQKCGDGHGYCRAGLVCVLFNESGKNEGYCTAYCSDSQPCPSSPAGGQCVFQLQSGDLICGFLCSAQQPDCPPGLACTRASGGD